MGREKKPKGDPELRNQAEAGRQSPAPEFQDLSPADISALINDLQAHRIELELQNDELRQSRLSLEEANQKYRDFFDFAPVGFLTLDASGMILETNLVAAAQLGINKGHLVRTPLRVFISAEDKNRFSPYLKRVFQAPGPERLELKLQRRNGEPFFAHLNSLAVTDAGGVRVCRTSITDINDRKEAERKLQASERLFASFVGRLPGVAVIRDLDGRYLFVNAAWEQAFQKTREECLGKTTEELWPPEVAAKFREQDRLVIESRKPLQTLGTLDHPDGPHLWFFHRFPIVGPDGQPVMIGLNAIDVTEPMATKARLEHLLASGPAALYTFKAEGDFAPTYVSDNVKALVGWESRHFLENPRFWIKHVHPQDRRRVLQRLEFPWPQDHQTFEYRFRARNGAYRWMHDEVKLIRDQNGQPVEIAGAWMDISSSKEMEEALRVSLRFLEIVHNFTDIKSLLTAFVSEIKRFTGCEAVGIRVLDAAGGIPYQAYEGFRRQFYEVENPLSIKTDHCMCVNVIKGGPNSKSPLYTPGGSFWMNATTRFLATVSEADKGRTRNLCNQEGYESVALIPIRWGDQTLGLIHIADPRENMVPLELVEMLEKAAMQLGTAFQRLKAEEALRDSEAKYRLLVNQIPAVVFKGYRDWSIDFFDRKIEHITGYSKEDFDSRRLKWCDLILPEDLTMASGLFLQALKTDKSYVREYRIRKKDGEIAWIQARGQIFFDAAGQVDYVSGVFFDITAQKQAEDALQETENQYRLLVNQIPAVVFKGYSDWRVNFLDRKVEELTGYDKEDFDSGKIKWCDLIHEDDFDYAQRVFIEGLKTNRSYVREHRIKRKDGTIRWVQCRGQIFCDAAGKVDHISGVSFDITARKEAETKILQERQRFFSLLDTLPASVCVVAPDFTLQFANRQYREIFGNPQGRACHELFHNRPSPCPECNLKDIIATQKPVEWERTTPQGRLYHVYNYPFADIDGSPMVLKLATDITERRTLEAQLLQAQKMEAVGRLAGGVAHDFNNLLMAIMGYGELIRSSLVKDDPLYKYSEDILKASERAASLTHQLLAFSRRQVTQPQVLNLNRVAADLEKMLRRLIGEHIELAIVPGPELGTVKADPGQIGQIIMNLAVNARDAMPTGGRLIISTANIEFADSHKCYGEAAPPGPYVRLEVTDTGSGMDAQTLDHIFEPFFTTKEMGKGTGLGLPMVYGIVKQNQGYIEVDSRPGQGAAFTIYLPRLEAAVAAPEARMSLAARLEGSETILLVEDEDALRTLLGQFFRLYGYNVMEARHGGEALLLCERHPGPIHLMVTDVVMPQMSGKELAERLAPLHPEMTVFFMSGYTDSDLSGYGGPDSSQYFIPKPFRPMDLVKKVRDFLDVSRGATA